MDVIQIINDAFWTAVLPVLPAEPPVIAIDGSDRFSQTLRALYRAPADGPKLGFEYVTQRSKPATRTFGQNRTGDTTDFRIAETYTFNVTVQNKKNGTEAVTPILGYVKKALYATTVYPHLGITAFTVTDFDFSPANAKPRSGSLIVCPFNVYCRPKRSQLVA